MQSNWHTYLSVVAAVSVSSKERGRILPPTTDNQQKWGGRLDIAYDKTEESFLHRRSF